MTDESRYPLSYEEFEEKMGKLFVRDAVNTYRDVTEEMAEKDWKKFLKEDGPQTHIYKERCEMYDNPQPGGIPKEKVFSDESLSAGPIYYIVMWVYF